MTEIRISKKTRTQGDDGHKIISLRAKVEILEQIEDVAKRTDRSRNELINLLLAEAIKQAVVEE